MFPVPRLLARPDAVPAAGEFLADEVGCALKVAPGTAAQRVDAERDQLPDRGRRGRCRPSSRTDKDDKRTADQQWGSPRQ
jgi:hypothetical protein